MSTLKAHGVKLGEIDFLTYRLGYMSDGNILKNTGSGWKLYRRLKAGVDPLAHYSGRLAAYNDKLARYPHNAAYRDALHTVSGLHGWWYIDETINAMPDDPDGVWSTFNDNYDYRLPKLTIDECVNLCRLFKLAELELKNSPPAPLNG